MEKNKNGLDDSNEKNVANSNIVEKYIYEVIKRVPAKQRKDIRMELLSLIDDMKAEEGASEEEILEKLGSPKEFAKRYKDENSYLIGPDYYDNYMLVLKIGAIALAISTFVSGIIHSILEASTIKGFVKEFIKEVLGAGVYGFFALVGTVTIIFYILERMNAKVDKKTEDKWTPSQLPEIPNKKARISRAGCIVAIMFFVIMIGVFIYVPEIFGVFEATENGYRSVSCIFNLEKWNSLVPFFVVIFVTGIFEEVVRVISGQYCKMVMYCSIICNTIGVICSVILLKFMDVFNPNFANDLLVDSGKEAYSKGDILHYWGTDRFSNIILGLFVLFSCIEVIGNIYNTLRYGEKNI